MSTLVDDNLRFPWPRDADGAVAVRLFVRSPVWTATVRRWVERWRVQSGHRLPVWHCGVPNQLSVYDVSPEMLAMVEVSCDNLLQLAEAVGRASQQATVVALLCRHSLLDAADQTAATRLLREAGADLVVASPQQLPRLRPLLDWFCRRQATRQGDRLDELPLPCWSPAWQSPSGRIGLNAE